MGKSYLTDAELKFLEELGRLRVKFMVVGMSAAVIQGSNGVTKDVDLWFSSLSDPKIDKAARSAGGRFSYHAAPLMLSGPNLDNIDVLWSCIGLRDFDEEYANAVKADFFGVAVKVLPLDRIIVSKKASGRSKDKIAIPHLKAALVANRARKSK